MTKITIWLQQMKFSARTYIIISVVSFIILATVQLFLVYNTYQLKNERYYFAEKDALKESYHTNIIGDKLFPGGQEIIDNYIFKKSAWAWVGLSQQKDWVWNPQAEDCGQHRAWTKGKTIR